VIQTITQEEVSQMSVINGDPCLCGATDEWHPECYAKVTSETSDGYHTFGELYKHRMMLWVCVLLANPKKAFKTRLDDKGEAWDGWFIAGMNTEMGQMTYHLRDEYWGMLSSVPEIEKNEGYDGHTSDDVLLRLCFHAGELLGTSLRPVE
jgi:hypothetical protein